MVASSNFFFGSSGFYPYEINSSMRFSSSYTACLEKTFSGAGNRKVFTFSTWTKINANTNSICFYQAGADAQNKTEFGLQGKALRFENEVSNDRDLKDTTALLRDFSQWYHLVYAIDLTQASNDDKVKLYINGVLQTEFDTDNTFANVNSNINAAATHYIGKRGYANSRYLDAYMAETHFIDGSQLAASSFGEEKQDVWIPKEYTGSYGTNGFYLKYNQTGSGTPSSSTMGADSSGNDNHFSQANINPIDSNLPDSPTNNFCTVNPLSDVSDIAIAFGDTNLANTTDSWPTVRGTFGPTSGKWYYEVNTSDQTRWAAGWATGEFINGTTFATNVADGLLAYSESTLAVYDFGTKRSINGSPAFDTSDILQVAIDIDAGKFWLGINNTWVNNSGGSAGNPASGTNELETFTAGTQMYPSFLNNGGNLTVNFGQDSSFNNTVTKQSNSDENGHGDFYYTPPSGFLALCAKNLPEPTISPLNGEDPSQYQLTKRWTGDGSEKSITTSGFQPDWVWIKHRDGTKDHRLFDSVRGANKRLASLDTAAETDMTQGLKSFDATGFTLGTAVSVNENTSTYVGWAWRAGGAPSADNSAGAGNTPTANSVKIDGVNLGSALAGSIAATRISANTKAGFSIISYTGNGTDGATIAHGLTSPEFSILKNRDNATNWDVCWTGFTSGTSLNLDTTAAEFSPTQGYQTLGASTITLNSGGSGVERVNTNNDEYVAYVFKSVEGYSKFGSYTGNGSSTGPFIYTGFRPAWLMVKRTDSTTSWYIYDNKRDDINLAGTLLQADNDAAEATSTTNAFDLVSNGFKARGTGGTVNASGGTFVYMAFAEMPFKYSNAR